MPLPERTAAFLHKAVGPGVPIREGHDSDARVAHQGPRGMAWHDLCDVRMGVDDPLLVDVVFPESLDDVVAAIRRAEQQGRAVIPRGGGTSVVGGLTAADPSTIIDMTHMNHILDWSPSDGVVHVQSGVTGPQLEQWLHERGYMFGHLPQSWEQATLGGYAVTSSAGQVSSGVGRFHDNVVQVTLATPHGVWTIGHNPATAMGPDFMGVVRASEGTLGIVSDLVLRIRPRPSRIHSEGALSPTWQAAINAARDLAHAGLTPHVLRISDQEETRGTWAMSFPAGIKGSLVNAYCAMRGVSDGCLVIMQWQGGSELPAKRRAAWKILNSHGIVRLGRGVGRSWEKHRFAGPYLRDSLIDAGYFVETFETATSWTQLAHARETVMEEVARLDARVYAMTHISHVYATGASLYFTILAPSTFGEHWSEVKTHLTDAIVSSGGTATHHHGVGTVHAPWLRQELGEQGMDVWRAIKGSCDPEGIMNPAVWRAWQR
jgi:alkyldihydroxyacetonephosphate synthase